VYSKATSPGAGTRILPTGFLPSVQNKLLWNGESSETDGVRPKGVDLPIRAGTVEIEENIDKDGTSECKSTRRRLAFQQRDQKTESGSVQSACESLRGRREVDRIDERRKKSGLAEPGGNRS